MIEHFLQERDVCLAGVSPRRECANFEELHRVVKGGVCASDDDLKRWAG